MLLIDVWHPPIWVSLAVIVGVLGATALLSLGATRSRRETPRLTRTRCSPRIRTAARPRTPSPSAPPARLSGAAPPRRRDPRLDVVVPERASDRDAVASVDDVVAVGALQHGDRGQRETTAVGERDPLPAPPHEAGGRAEAGVEGGGEIDRSRRSRAER